MTVAQNKSSLKFWILISIFGCIGLFLLLRATVATAANVYLPSELLAQGRDISRLRVAGRVAELPVGYEQLPQLRLTFSIINPPKNAHDDTAVVASKEPLPVIYYGAKPDMFAPGRDVIIDGEIKNGTVVAHKLLTQCPSKYEAPNPEDVAAKKYEDKKSN